MNLQRIVSKISKGDIHYALGRFRTVRLAYGGIRRLSDGRVWSQQKPHSTLFPNANIGDIVKAISEEAVFIGLNLPASVVANIDAFARSEPLHANYDPHGPTFHYADVHRGKAPDGRSVPIGGVREPTRCSAVKAVVNDPVLRSIVRNYLGHEPREVMAIINWSFASDSSDDELRRLKQHHFDYHYDVDGYNFVYASFYITDTDRYSGAHVMMKRSHNRKPLRMLLGSAATSEANVRKRFGIENEIIIEGPAGTGFVQDTSCYHRATPPTRGDRLMLAVRFIN